METLDEMGKRLGLVLTNWTTAVVADEAHRRGIAIEQGRGSRIILTSPATGRKSPYAGGLNIWSTRLARAVMKNKDATAAMLAAASIRVPEGHVFKKGEATRAWEFTRSWDKSVVKPVDSALGTSVYIGLGDEEVFRVAFDRVAADHGRVLVQEHLFGVERRYVVVDGKVVAVSERRPASVLGDGVSTLRQLVNTKNLSRPPTHVPVPLDEEALNLLEAKGLDEHAMPAKGERVYLRRLLNMEGAASAISPGQRSRDSDGAPLLPGARPLDEGGDVVDRTDEASCEAIATAEAAAKALPGARIVGLDLMEPAAESGRPAVIEMNSGPMIGLHHFPAEGTSRNVARDVLNAIFPPTD